MRVTTAFNRLLRLPGASVIDVSFGAEGVIVTVRLRRRRRVCAALRADRPASGDPRPAGEALAASGSRRQPVRDRVRAAPAALPRLRRAPGGGAVGQARRAAHARLRGRRRVAGAADGQDADRRAACGSRWDTVGQIVERVVADHLDERRLQGLVAIGVDEISYRRGQRYLTTVVDHRAGAIVWCAPGRNAATLQGFFDLLGERKRLDPGRLDRHVRRLPAGDPREHPSRRGLLRPLPRRAPRPARGRPGPPRRVERPRPLAHHHRQMDQGHPLVAAQGARQADHRPARKARRSPASQQAALPRVPAQRGAPAALPARRPRARTSAPRRLARPGHRDHGSSRSSSSPAPSAAKVPRGLYSSDHTQPPHFFSVCSTSVGESNMRQSFNSCLSPRACHLAWWRFS